MERTDYKQTENEQTEVAAHTAEAENITGAAATEVSLGKFKDVKSLLKAYENLESEFTRRSKRLKELEGEISKQKEEITRRGASSFGGKDFGEGLSVSADNPAQSDKTKAAVTETVSGEERGIDSPGKIGETQATGGETDKQIVALPTDKEADGTEEIVKAYLLSVLKSRPPVSPFGGAAVTVPPRKPKSFEEAGRLITNDLHYD